MSSLPSPAIGPDLRAALIAMVRKRVPESEVEDIVQSTLADAIESPHAPEDSESLRRWIFGVAKNKVVDYHRRAGREMLRDELPEVPGKPAPHAEADLLRWAEKNLPPGEENKTTLDWMLREGEGEKLEWIAENENVPAPRVRQRVSRLRRHLKTHWQKEVALLATLGVLIGILFLVLRKKEPEPIANENLPRAAEMRKVALEKCAAADWKNCVERLDEAKQLDPAGDTRPEVREAREAAGKGLQQTPAPDPTPTPPSPAPSLEPTSNLTPPPAPTSPIDFAVKEAKQKEEDTRQNIIKPSRKFEGKTPATFGSSTPTPTAPPPAKPQAPPASKMKGTGGGGGSSSMDIFDSSPKAESPSKADGDRKDFGTKAIAPAAKKKSAPPPTTFGGKTSNLGSKSSPTRTTVPSVNVKPASSFDSDKITK